jgi:hypothetical protein
MNLNFIQNSVRQRPFRKLGCRYLDNTKLDLTQLKFEVVGWTEQSHNRMQAVGACKEDNDHSASINLGSVLVGSIIISF